MRCLGGPAPLGPLAARVVVGLLGVIGIAVVVGTVALWPNEQKVDIPLPFQNAAGAAVSTEAGHVLSSRMATCGSPSAGAVLTAPPAPAPPVGAQCALALIGIDSGPNSGANTLLELRPGPGQPHLAAGDHVRLSRQVDQGGATSYAFYDFERTWALIGLAAAFAVIIVAVARWRGLRALLGIVAAFVVLVVFLLPALRDGAPAIPVALIASAAILYAVIYLAHGVSLQTSAALLGTLASLLLAAVFSFGGNPTRAPDRTVGRPERRSVGLPRTCVDHRAAAGRLHHRLPRRAEQRHPLPRRRRCSNWQSLATAHPGGWFSAQRCGWGATTSPARCTRWCWPTPAARCHCCCCSVSLTAL